MSRIRRFLAWRRDLRSLYLADGVRRALRDEAMKR